LFVSFLSFFQVLLADNQQMWNYLKPLFAKSSILKEKLSGAVTRFESLQKLPTLVEDHDVIEMLQQGLQAYPILKACNTGRE